MRRLRIAVWITAIVAVVAGVVQVVGAGAQSADDLTLAEALSRQAEINEESSTLLAQIDLLTTRDRDLVELLAALEASVAAAERRVDARRSELDQATTRKAAALDMAELFASDVQTLDELARERAVEAYINRATDVSAEALANPQSLNDALVGVTMIDAVGSEINEVVRQLRKVEVAQRSNAVEEDVAAAAAAAATALLNVELEQLNRRRLDLQAVRTEVNARISALENEAAELARLDDEVGDFIRAEQVRLEAERAAAFEAARLAALEAELDAELAANRAAATAQAEADRVAAEREAAAESAPSEERTAADRPADGTGADESAVEVDSAEWADLSDLTSDDTAEPSDTPEPSEIAASGEAAESANSAESTDSAESSDSVESDEPIELEASDEPADEPVDAASTDEAEPAAPTEPAVDDTDSGESTTTEAPVDEAAPEPDDSGNSDEPAEATETPAPSDEAAASTEVTAPTDESSDDTTTDTSSAGAETPEAEASDADAPAADAAETASSEVAAPSDESADADDAAEEEAEVADPNAGVLDGSQASSGQSELVIPDPPPVADASLMIWPLPGAVVSGFGNRIHPIYGTVRHHAGLDIDGDMGEAQIAALGGTVISVGWNGGYGNTVIIDHGEGIATLYAHMSDFAVNQGDVVDQGQVIGYTGSTGNSTGPHLHFEVRVDGTAVDPLNFLPAR